MAATRPVEMAPVVMTDVVKRFTVRTRAGGLRRERRDVVAVDLLSLAIDDGELCGFIGPNGAGKSTTVKLLTGILTPTGGRIRVLGLDPTRQRAQLARQIGVVFGQRTQLWWDLPLDDSFELLRHMYRIPATTYQRNRKRLVELLELGDLLATPVRQLSLGQRMRGDLTAAFLHSPALVYLDEPTIGLDVVSKLRVRDFLAEVNRDEGTTILLTTHDLADVEQLCSRVVVIDHGKLLHDGTVGSLRMLQGNRRTVVVDLQVPGAPLSVPDTTVEKVEGPRQWLSFDGSHTTAAEVIKAIVSSGVDVVDLSIEETPIEQVVHDLYQGVTRA